MNYSDKIIAIACGLVILCGMTAQAAVTARWIVSPEYDSVERFATNSYLVRQNGHVGLVDTEGRTIVRPEADSITTLKEGLAVVATRDAEGRYAINAIVRDDNTVATPEKEVFLTQYPFYSDGLIPVSNPKGACGYMDRNGFITVPFKYSNPHPFSDGLAAVSKAKGSLLAKARSIVPGNENEKVFYIDRNGNELKLAKEIGDVILGTTFKNGEALVITKQRRNCFINTSGRLLRISPDIQISFDEKGALIDETQPPHTTVPQLRPDGPDVFSEGAMTGYRQGSSIILPPQFSTAEPFIGGYARASKFGKWGVLGLVDGSVRAEVRKGSLPSTDPSKKSIDVEVALPTQFNGQEITVDVFDKSGKMLSHIDDPDDGTGKHLVSLIVPSEEYDLNVCVDGLILWTSHNPSQYSAANNQKGEMTISFSSVRAKANAKDNAAITVTVENNSSSAISAPVKIRGAYCGTKQVKLAPGAKTNLTLSFAKISRKETRNVTVTIGENTASRKVTLIPFFTDI